MLRPADKSEPARLPARAWTWLAVVGAVAALLSGEPLGRWIAVALLLAVAPALSTPLAGLGARLGGPRLLRALPVLLVVGLAGALLGDLALGRPPASRDHGIHYFQTKVLVDELIPQGQLIGFSYRLNSGYPFGDSYPVLGYLLTGAANLLSAGLISLRTSYAWGLLVIWVVALVAVWWLATTIGRELVGTGDDSDDDGDDSDKARAVPALLDPRWAGAFAAIAWLIDPGSSREGGWNYLMFHGVWPQALSAALWVASLPATWLALRRPSPRTLAAAALLLGGSVLAHPFGMLTAATSAVAWPVVVWATGALRDPLPPGAIRWWLLIHIGAGLVCVGWLFVFMASADEMARSPVPWKPLGALATELFAGELFQDHRAWVGPLAVIGLLAGIRRGRTMTWLGVGLVCALLVLASEAAITVLRLDLLVSGFKNLQFPRYTIALKPVLYAFTGVGAAVLAARLRAVPDRDLPLVEGQPAPAKLRPTAARLVAAVCLAPLLVGVVDDRGRLLPRPVGVEVLEGSVHEVVDQELLTTLLAERALLEGEGRPLDVAFLRRGMGGGTYPLFAITDADAELVLDGHIPAVNYKHQVRRRSPEALRLMGVTHVLYDLPLSRSSEDLQLLEQLEEVGQFGAWTLARLRPEPASLGFEPRLAIDPQQVELEWLGRTRLLVHLRAGGPGRVDLPLGPYRKWQVSRRGGPNNGEIVEVEETALRRGVPGLSLSFAQAETLEVVYETPPLERALGWVSLVAIGLLLPCLLWARPLALVGRLHGPLATKISWGLGLTTAAVVLAWAFHRQELQLAQTWDKLLVEHMASSRLARGRDLHFARDLVDDGAWSVSRSNPDGCDGLLGKDAMAGCAQEDAEPRVSMAYRKPYLYRCLRVEVPARGSVTVYLEGLEADEDIAGFIVREGRSFEGIRVMLPHDTEERVPPADQRRIHFHAAAEDYGRDEMGRGWILLRNVGGAESSFCLALATSRP